MKHVYPITDGSRLENPGPGELMEAIRHLLPPREPDEAAIGTRAEYVGLGVNIRIVAGKRRPWWKQHPAI